MDAEQLLRRYLEQRRELGEREFVLDELNVEDVLKILGARRAPGPRTEPAPAPTPAPRTQTDARPTAEPPDAGPGDWRAALRAAEPPPPRPPDTGTPLTVVRTPEDGEFLRTLQSVSSIDGVASLIGECRRCPLFRTALNHVPGEGNPNADFMCVGEAPGETEDETGRPFVGRAGQLLTKILGAINLSREEVFIANVLKHRPPRNRDPESSEVKACRPYLVRQIELVQPKVVLALGTFAAQSLLETTLPLGRLRGTVHSFAGVPVVVTYHPAALLRNPHWKRPAWEDVQHARRILDSALA